MYTYQKESYESVVDDIAPILELHWQETGLFLSKVELDPDWNKYRTLIDLDAMQVFTIRDNNKLIAYMIITVSTHLHTRHTKCAIGDMFYVDKEYRRLGFGDLLFEYVEKEMIKQEVKIFIVGMKIHANLGNFLMNLGFTHTESLFSKYIGE